VKLVLFDVDGTLVRSHGASLRVMEEAAAAAFGIRADFSRVDPNGRLDPQILQDGLGTHGIQITPEVLAEFKKFYFPLLAAAGSHFRLLPGVKELMERLDEAGLVKGLVTGNFGPSAKLKVEAAGLPFHQFRVNAFGDETPDRSSLVLLALQRAAEFFGEAVSPKQVAVVGDTPRDVVSAKAHGCISVAVATGRYSVETLRASVPDLCVSSLHPTEELLAAFGLA